MSEGQDYRSARMPSAEGHRNARHDVLELFAKWLEYPGASADLAFDSDRDEDEPESVGWFERKLTPYARGELTRSARS
jgi:hypothetical protein